MTSSTPVILFAGGGTGGHIYPNVAIVERLEQARGAQGVHFLVSDRRGDATIMNTLPWPHTASPILPMPSPRNPVKALAFARSWRKATRQVLGVMRRHRVAAVVATGGFVSGPAIVAAARLRIPRILVNLDAIPGLANRYLGRLCSRVYSAYASPLLPTAVKVGFPLRQVSLGREGRRDARAALGLKPEKNLLFVTGATHGAESIIRTMMAWVAAPQRAGRLEHWQVLHQCGTFDPQVLQHAYQQAGVDAKVVPYCDNMGRAWSAADLVISRAGAGSVAEAWANAAPTLFLPNPYHKDQHQRHNAQPLADVGGAAIVEDKIDAERNVDHLGPTLTSLIEDETGRQLMRDALEQSRPPDGAQQIAMWLAGHVGPSTK